MLAAHLFTWIQGADFYRSLHAEAVAMLAPADGAQTWIDVGCGPGLVARLAAARGYQARGIDLQPAMIRSAQRIARRTGSPASFQVGAIASLRAASATVVSAASLLAVLPQPRAGLADLWRGVRPGGSLLIIEPTPAMTVARARQLLAQERLGRRTYGLYLWAAARQGRSVDPAIYDTIAAAHRAYRPLLHGLVGAWLFTQRE